MTLINLWLVPQQICNAACSYSGSRQNFDYFGYNMSCAQYLQDQGQLDNKPEASAFSLWIQAVLCFGTPVVVVSLVLVINRAANYSTASLKLMPSHLCSGLNTNRPC